MIPLCSGFVLYKIIDIEVTYTESENGQVCFIVFGVKVKYAFIGFINGFSEIGMNVMMELGP